MTTKKRTREHESILENLRKGAKKDGINPHEKKVDIVPNDKTEKALNDKEPDHEYEPEPKEKTEKENYFQTILEAATDHDVMFEYSIFLKKLPTSLHERLRKKKIYEIEEKLKIEDVKKRIIMLPVASLPRFNNKSETETPILDAFSTMMGMGWRIVAPPTSKCIFCGDYLTEHNAPTQVLPLPPPSSLEPRRSESC